MVTPTPETDSEPLVPARSSLQINTVQPYLHSSTLQHPMPDEDTEWKLTPGLLTPLAVPKTTGSETPLVLEDEVIDVDEIEELDGPESSQIFPRADGEHGVHTGNQYQNHWHAFGDEMIGGVTESGIEKNEGQDDTGELADDTLIVGASSPVTVHAINVESHVEERGSDEGRSSIGPYDFSAGKELAQVEEEAVATERVDSGPIVSLENPVHSINELDLDVSNGREGREVNQDDGVVAAVVEEDRCEVPDGEVSPDGELTEVGDLLNSHVH